MKEATDTKKLGLIFSIVVEFMDFLALGGGSGSKEPIITQTAYGSTKQESSA